MYMIITTVTLLMGIRSQNKPRRLQCYVVLFSSTPLFIFANVIILQLLRILPLNQYVNATFAAPFGIIIFCIGTGYAIYRHRLVDIEFYIPWSHERRAKQDFYKRITKASVQMAQLQGPEEAMRYISEVLRCPVVVRSRNETIMTPSPISQTIAEMPIEKLSHYDRIVTADESAYNDTELADLMRKHKVFAAVPVPQGAGADTVVIWLLLGEALSETVYSNRDFAMVGLLFQRMEIVLINQLSRVRQEMTEMRLTLTQVQSTCNMLVEQISALAGNQPVALLNAMNRNAMQLIKSEEAEIANRLHRTAHGLLYIGKDRALFYALRKAFPHIRKVAYPGAKTLIGSNTPAVIVYDRTGVTHADEVSLITALEAVTQPVSCYVLGQNTGRFVEQYDQHFREVTILQLPANSTPESIAQELFKEQTASAQSPGSSIHLDRLVEEFERKVIEMALLHSAWNQAIAARLLDLSPSTLSLKITRHGIVRPESNNRELARVTLP